MEPYVISEQSEKSVAKFMTRVYSWMTLALALTGLVAYYTASSETLLKFIFGSQLTFWGLIIGTFLLVMWINAGIKSMSQTTASAVFVLYSVLNGLLFSSIFLVYTGASIGLTFLITAGTFGAMSLYGITTGADLTRIGNMAFMALIGIIIASLVNMFLESETLYWIISYAGVAVFVILIAYDTQKLKNLALQGIDEGTVMGKLSIIGALTLYLDFINLFLYLLRLFGSRRN